MHGNKSRVPALSGLLTLLIIAGVVAVGAAASKADIASASMRAGTAQGSTAPTLPTFRLDPRLKVIAQTEKQPAQISVATPTATETFTSTGTATNTPTETTTPTSTATKTNTVTSTPEQPRLIISSVDVYKLDGNSKELNVVVWLVDQNDRYVTDASFVHIQATSAVGQTYSEILQNMGNGSYRLCGWGKFSGGAGNVLVEVLGRKTGYQDATGTTTNKTGSYCGVTPATTSTPTSTSTSTSTATETATETPTASETAAETSTPAYTATSTATATATGTHSATTTATATQTSTGISSSTSTEVPNSTSTPAAATTTTTATRTSTTEPSQTSPASATGTAVPPATSTACPVRFNDVHEGSTFYSYARCMACRGVISGYGCGAAGEPCPGSYLRPGANVTRGQISKMVAIAAELVEPVGVRKFEDVPEGSTFYLWIQQLANSGAIRGYPCGGTNPSTAAAEPCVGPGNRPYFRPNNITTRGQLSKIVSEAAGFTEDPGVQQFGDVPPDATFSVWVQRLYNRNVVSGYTCGGTNPATGTAEPCDASSRPYFHVNNNVTRGQASKIVAETHFPNCVTPARR
ncbi:MAG TPA: S-layer homology domain-containing protein [Chloroflexia bacterium]